jgi:hypothetical protein
VAATPPAGPLPSPTGASSLQAPRGAITPFPIVRISGSYATAGVRLKIFTVTAPAGVRVTVRCRGRGCPYAKRGPIVVRGSAPRGGGARVIAIGGFRKRLLRPGARVQVFVEHPSRIGKFTRFTIQRRRPPSRVDRCLGLRGSIRGCG